MKKKKGHAETRPKTLGNAPLRNLEWGRKLKFGRNLEEVERRKKSIKKNVRKLVYREKSLAPDYKKLAKKPQISKPFAM